MARSEEIPIADCGKTERYITQWVLYEECGRRTFLHHPQSADLYEAAPDAALWLDRAGPDGRTSHRCRYRCKRPGWTG